MLGGLKKHMGTVAIAFVVALVTAGGPAVAAIINADKLNGYKANQLIRVAEFHINDNAITGSTSGTAASASINAPKNGYLFIVASSDVFNYNAADSYNCKINLDGTIISSSDRQADITADSHETDCMTNVAWPVAKGTHTVHFDFSSLATNTTVDETTLQVIYEPFDSIGAPAIPVTPAVGSNASNS